MVGKTLKRLATAAVACATLVAASQILMGFVGPFRAASALASTKLVLPTMNAQNGKTLFASKGCVVCHSINGVGGSDAAPLDASSMDAAGNPFEFFARMLAGMQPMLAMQERRLGHQVELTAQELGDLVAFIHDEAEQSTFSAADIPKKMEELMGDD